METNITKSIELIRRGTEQIIDINELTRKLEKSARTKIPLTVKLGVDPTAPDIHLGHTVPFRKLKHFQDLGHEICFLIGDFTARIGDPSGKNKTRPALTEEDIRLNAETYLQQIGKILDTSKLKVVFNSHWLNDLSFSELIKMTSHITMSRMLEHNTFRKRLDESESIRIHELLYPFMQGFDSVALNADVELGGSDQTFNLTFGRDLQKLHRQEPQVCITMPILTGTDGVQKMSKSLGNSIGISESPCAMLEKLMRMNDSNITNFFTLLTDVHAEEILEIEKRLRNNPETDFIIDAKKKLAFEIIRIFHSEESAAIALESHGKINKPGLPEVSIKKINGHRELAVMMAFHLGVDSKSEARRLVTQGVVKINGKKLLIANEKPDIQPGDIIQIGKLKSFKFVA